MEEERSDKIRGCRPVLEIEYTPTEASVELVFQNEVLRPILKFQNKLILGTFIDYCLKKKINLGQKKPSEVQNLVKKILSRDQRIRFTLIGVVTGMFTIEEQKYYLENEKEINKRITSMMRERIISQI